MQITSLNLIFAYIHLIRVISKKEEHDLQFSITDAMKDAKLSRSESGDSDTEHPSPDLPQIRSEYMISYQIF